MALKHVATFVVPKILFTFSGLPGLNPSQIKSQDYSSVHLNMTWIQGVVNAWDGMVLLPLKYFPSEESEQISFSPAKKMVVLVQRAIIVSVICISLPQPLIEVIKIPSQCPTSLKVFNGF